MQIQTDAPFAATFPRIRLEGIISLLLTPFREDKSIDWPTYDAYVEWQVSHQPAGLFAVCGSSEMHTLTLDERLQLATRAVQRAGDVPVLATANLESEPAKHGEELQQMVSTGVSGIVLIPRASFASDLPRYLAYFQELIGLSPVPVFLYEWPHVQPCLLDPWLVGQLAGSISGIKDTTCTMEGIEAKIAVAGNAVIYQANTAFLLDAFASGARGSMAITSTCYPDLSIALWHAFESGDEQEAARLHRELVTLNSLLGVGYPLTAKHLVARRGIPILPVTRTSTSLQPQHLKSLDIWNRPYISNDTPRRVTD